MPEVKKEAKKEVQKAPKADGSMENPFPWVPPYPATKLDKEGKETVFVKGELTQDVILNSAKMSAGPQVMGAGFAHQHAAVIAAPKE